jgi:uncharacterized protein YbaP (TraB family)
MIRRLLALATLTLVGCAAPEAEAKPPIWIVRDADSEIVLFGSVHVLPPGLDWRPARLEAALAAADDLWFELPIDRASESETANLAATRGVLPQGASLFAQLSPEGAARLKRAAEAQNLSPALLDRLEPWFAEVALAGAIYRQAGGDAASGVEKSIAASAPASAQRRAFETPGEQIALFDAAPASEQVASLEQSLKELETKPDGYMDLVNDWITGDLKGIDEEALKPLRAAAPGLYARVVTERNARWTATLQQRMAGEGRTVVVVGVGHLVGPDGLPARLRALGYSVEGP